MFECNCFLSAILEFMSSLDVHKKLRAGMESIVLKGKPPTNIFKKLQKIKGDAVIAYSPVKKWVSRIKGEEDPSLSDLNEEKKEQMKKQKAISSS